MLTRKKLQTTIILTIGIILLINIISDRFFVRLDFTANHQYSLSQATKNILKSLNEPVTVTAYFSGNLPPNVERVRSNFKDLLIEYSNYADGNLVYDFVNPTKNQRTEMEAQQAGIMPIMINVRQKDQLKQQKAYLGAVVLIGDKKEAIPFIQPGSPMEYTLSSTIKKLTVKNKPVVGFLQGNGEPPLAAMQQVRKQLSVLYRVKTVAFTDTSGVPENIKTLLIVAPKDSMSAQDFKYLNLFILRGGKLLVAANRVKGNFKTGKGEEVKTNIFGWLKKLGINVQDDFVVDVSSSSVMVRQQRGLFVMNTPVRFPYVPIVTKFADNPITKGLESVVFPFVSPIKFISKDTSVTFIPLAITSKKSGIEAPPLYFNITKQWGETDFMNPSLTVAAAIKGKILGNIKTKMVVFGDGDFAVNGIGQKARKLQSDNISLMANAVDWLSDDTGLISLRTKEITSRPLNVNISQSTKTFLKYLNFLLPILLISGYGFFRFQLKRKKRKQIQSINYE